METKFNELNLHLDMYVCYNSNQKNTIYGATTIKDQSIVALNEIEMGKYTKPTTNFLDYILRKS